MDDLEAREARLLQERIIFLGNAIDDELAERVVGQFQFLEQANAQKDIFFYVNSPGGSISASLKIHHAMSSISSDVVTVCSSIAYGSASWLVAKGTPGKRMALPSAKFTLGLVQMNWSLDYCMRKWLRGTELMC